MQSVSTRMSRLSISYRTLRTILSAVIQKRILREYVCGQYISISGRIFLILLTSFQIIFNLIVFSHYQVRSLKIKNMTILVVVNAILIKYDKVF